MCYLLAGRTVEEAAGGGDTKEQAVRGGGREDPAGEGEVGYLRLSVDYQYIIIGFLYILSVDYL